VIASGRAEFDGGTRDFVFAYGLLELTAMVPIPRGRVVSRASPNPFRNDVTLSINIPPMFETTELTLLHSSGSFYEVVTLKWDGRTASGRPAASGVYFIRVKAGPAFAVQKVLLVR
jgi:hypothetical protein